MVAAVTFENLLPILTVYDSQVEVSPVQYTLTMNTVGNGSVSLNPPGGTYDAGTVVQLTAEADPSWEFVGWSGDLGGSANPTTITMNGDRTVTATFVPIPQYDLTINIIGYGSVDLDPSGGNYYEGTEVELTAYPDSGSQFIWWSGDLGGSTNPMTITMNGDRTVTATFVPIPEYDLTINIIGYGSVDLDPSGGNYYEGTEVELTAYPDSGWVFSIWSGDLSGSANPTSIIMDSDKTVAGYFVKTDTGENVIFLPLILH